MLNLLVIFIGGGLGAMSRYGVSQYAIHQFGKSFPYGTLICNITGCLVIGFLAAIFLFKLDISYLWRSALITGFLGGYTTFSSFSLDALTLIQEGEVVKAFTYIVSSVLLSLILVYAGFFLGKAL